MQYKRMLDSYLLCFFPCVFSSYFGNSKFNSKPRLMRLGDILDVHKYIHTRIIGFYDDRQVDLAFFLMLIKFRAPVLIKCLVYLR